jgi:hypothetical protein
VAEPQGVSVYNFTVADDHTYFVEGASNHDTTGTAAATPLDAVWVHNSCNPLRDNMIENGQAPEADQEAHHIVAKTANNADAQATREILAAAEIDVDDPANGVFLDRSVHRGIHTNAYYAAVRQRLEQAYAADGAEGVKQELGNIKTQIVAGIFPH